MGQYMPALLPEATPAIGNRLLMFLYFELYGYVNDISAARKLFLFEFNIRYGDWARYFIFWMANSPQDIERIRQDLVRLK
jgi:hypothetical protein